MVFINEEGKFNDNTYLVDGNQYGAKGNLALYVIENEDQRLLIDTTSEIATRKIVQKLKELDIYPIHKLLLTHSHWDHIAGVAKLKKLMKESEFEVLASKNAINNLKNPEKMNDVYGFKVKPIENVTPLNDGDIIDLNGLKLKVLNFFGHTMDSIAIFDEKNKNLVVGDAIMIRSNPDTFAPAFMPPDFSEPELLKTYQNLRGMKDLVNSISLSHFGVWTDEDFDKILNEMEDFHFKTKDSIIKWYNEDPSPKSIASKYHDSFIPNSTSIPMDFLEVMFQWIIEGLKRSGFI